MANSAFNIGAYVTATSAWVTGTVYSVGNAVTYGGLLYACLIAHTAGTFATDLAAGKWQNVTVSGGTGGTNIKEVWLKD